MIFDRVKDLEEVVTYTCHLDFGPEFVSQINDHVTSLVEFGFWPTFKLSSSGGQNPNGKIPTGPEIKPPRRIVGQCGVTWFADRMVRESMFGLN